MIIDVLVAEIGSTTTVVNAFSNIDTKEPFFWGQGQAPTTVLEGDVRIGLNNAIENLCTKKEINKKDFQYKEMFATSSAAGGLKMTVHGLVYDMTAKAAREAALGAGGIIHYITAGKLRRTDLNKIKEINPNIILLAGGVDFGERETAIYNAELLKSMNMTVPLIYAGNIENQEEIKLLFEETGIKLYIVENVYPKIDQLCVEPCRKVIQEVFEEHIIYAPGMEHVRELVSGSIIPTPGAVMECAKLLNECIGNVVVIDVGGATTDIHSVAEDSDQVSRLLVNPEPKAKRTVEGDLGVYINREKIIENIGREKLCEELEKEGIKFDEVFESYSSIPKNENEIKFVQRLTEEAVLRAMERHAGTLRYVYGPSGRATIAEGKDLTQVKYIIGTGGALVKLPKGKKILEKIGKANCGGMMLSPPEGTEILIDKDYIMASIGVLSRKHRDGAIRLLEKSLKVNL